MLLEVVLYWLDYLNGDRSSCVKVLLVLIFFFDATKMLTI